MDGFIRTVSIRKAQGPSKAGWEEEKKENRFVSLKASMLVSRNQKTFPKSNYPQYSHFRNIISFSKFHLGRDLNHLANLKSVFVPLF